MKKTILIVLASIILSLFTACSPAAGEMKSNEKETVAPGSAETGDFRSIGDAVVHPEYYMIDLDPDQWISFLHTDLYRKGYGEFDFKSAVRTPLTDRLYSFDFEVFYIDQMYNYFLQGIDSIVPDVQITEISEDLSEMDESYVLPDFQQNDGKRSVSFRCNGNEYSIQLDSFGDWINPEIIPFLNQVLEQEHCEKRVWCLSREYDQIAVMVYAESPESAINVIYSAL